jgi:hypothetical protein
LFTNIDIKRYFSNSFTSPIEINDKGSVTSAYTFKYNKFLEVTGFSDNWNIVVERGEEDIVIKRVIAGFFPFLPSTGILSTSNEDHVSDLDEDTN